MGWRMTEAVDEFLAEAGEFLRADRVRNTVILTVTETLRTQPAAYQGPAGSAAPALGWWRAGDAGGSGVNAAFMQTPPFPLVLTAMSEEAAATLAHQLADAGREIPGLNAPAPAAQAFTAAWRDRTGSSASVHQRHRLFRLGDLTWPSPTPDGTARIATDADRDLLVAWLVDFTAEAGDMVQRDQAQVVDERLSYQGLTIWECGGVPVSVAGVTPTVAGMTRVGPVYTPPELRGRGYAGAATAAVSQAARDAGAAEVLLYTDLANPTSNALYQRLGYQAVEDRMLLTFG